MLIINDHSVSSDVSWGRYCRKHISLNHSEPSCSQMSGYIHLTCYICHSPWSRKKPHGSQCIELIVRDPMMELFCVKSTRPSQQTTAETTIIISDMNHIIYSINNKYINKQKKTIINSRHKKTKRNNLPTTRTHQTWTIDPLSLRFLWMLWGITTIQGLRSKGV